MVYWKGSCPLLVGGLLLLNEVLLLQRQEEWSQKEGARSVSLNRGKGALWCVPKKECSPLLLGTQRGGRGMRGVQYCRQQ